MVELVLERVIAFCNTEMRTCFRRSLSINTLLKRSLWYSTLMLIYLRTALCLSRSSALLINLSSLHYLATLKNSFLSIAALSLKSCIWIAKSKELFLSSINTFSFRSCRSKIDTRTSSVYSERDFIYFLTLLSI